MDASNPLVSAQRGRRARHETNGNEEAATGNRHGTDDHQAERSGAAGKPSGAGGGDCGIVLAPAATSRRDLLADWEAHDIRRLELHVHPPEGAAA